MTSTRWSRSRSKLQGIAIHFDQALFKPHADDGIFLYSESHGPANRNNFQDWNIEGPKIMDTTWFSSLNNSINNMTGPLPFTPKYEFKLSGSYVIPKIEADFGVRLRYNSGRPYWFLEDFPVVRRGILTIRLRERWWIRAERRSSLVSIPTIRNTCLHPRFWICDLQSSSPSGAARVCKSVWIALTFQRWSCYQRRLFMPVQDKLRL